MSMENNTPEQRAADCLKAILADGASIRDNWLGYGAAMNEMKAQHPGDNNAFGAAVKAAKLNKWPEGYSPNLGEYNIKNDVRTAAMWAAALPPDELAALEAEHPNTEVTVRGGFRGLRAAVTQAEKRDALDDDTPDEAETETALEALADEDDHDAVRKLIVKRVVGLLSKEFEIECSDVTGDIYVTINGTEYHIGVNELDENGNTIWR